MRYPVCSIRVGSPYRRVAVISRGRIREWWIYRSDMLDVLVYDYPVSEIGYIAVMGSEWLITARRYPDRMPLVFVVDEIQSV